MSFAECILLAGYLSLAVELIIFPVPSVASSRQLLSKEQGSASAHTVLGKARSLPLALKMVLLFLPTLLIIGLFLLPPLLALRPDFEDFLVPLLEPAPPWLPFLGALFVAAGRLLTFASTLALRQARQQPLRGELDLPLQTGRLFRRSRNPGLLGMYLFFAGLLLYFPNVVLLTGFAGYLLHMHFRILMEESHLEARYGRAYQRYCRQTPRYL
ncbi:MAG: isoprenylcysteine carboxylmethyltransferase family protein [Verrucomicrobia bacterium]|nr:isoprenylcysteine carboxylmethyltransferase family protein [Verrucomicrobiota bacterium]